MKSTANRPGTMATRGVVTLGLLTLGLLALAAAPLRAEPAAPLSALAQIPIKEVTVFKDGHAFVVHEGRLPTDAAGHVLLDYLPTPVLGTFWPYSANPAAKLTSVVAGQRKVKVERTAMAIKELIEANLGALVTVTEIPQGHETTRLSYDATILGVLGQSGEEQESINPPNSGEKLPLKSNLVLLRIGANQKVVSMDRIQDLVFLGKSPNLKAGSEEFRNLLTLRLDWGGQPAAKEAEVGLVYLQRGLRWLPSYKVTIDGQGSAQIKLEATLVNELADLQDVTANLVIGVPSFEFKETLDPMAMQQAAAQLSGYFSQTGRRNLLSNAIQTQQVARWDGDDRESDSSSAVRPADLGPEVAGSTKREDLYVFTISHITLKKGQRLVVPVAETTLPYRDVFTLDLPFAPPLEMARSLNSDQQRQLAQVLSAPLAMHKIRLSNQSAATQKALPLTTAPALILLRDKDGPGSQVLGQGLMTYTAVGSQSDLAITKAVDIRVKKSEKESSREANARTWDGHQFARVSLEGSLKITSFRDQPVELEVTRHVLGNVDAASGDGKIEMVNIFEDSSFAPGGDDDGLPFWWRGYSWPYWWSHFNGVGRIKWTVKLEPGKETELTYKWNYFWRP